MEYRNELQDRIDAIKAQIKQLQDTQTHIQDLLDNKFPSIGSEGEINSEKSSTK